MIDRPNPAEYPFKLVDGFRLLAFKDARQRAMAQAALPCSYCVTPKFLGWRYRAEQLADPDYWHSAAPDPEDPAAICEGIVFEGNILAY